MYIPLIEDAREVLVLLRPRRMGKSLLVSMLEHYYDIKYKDQFQDLFGHLYIGQEGSTTPEHNSYLVLTLDFSSLNTASVEEFKASLNRTINESIEGFKFDYGDYLKKEVKLYKEDATSSFQSLCNAVSRSKFANKVDWVKEIEKVSSKIIQNHPNSIP